MSCSQLLSTAQQCPKKCAIAGIIKAIFIINHLLYQFMVNPRLPTERGDVFQQPRTATKLFDMKQDKGKAWRFLLKPFYIKCTKILSDDCITGYKSCIFNSSLSLIHDLLADLLSSVLQRGLEEQLLPAETFDSPLCSHPFSPWSCALTNTHNWAHFLWFFFFCKNIFLPMNLTVYIQWKVTSV